MDNYIAAYHAGGKFEILVRKTDCFGFVFYGEFASVSTSTEAEMILLALNKKEDD